MAQVKNRGTPHIINYPKKTYRAASQSWSISQDRRGFMYFGNNDGILEFDGRRWTLHSLPDRFMYRAVCVASDGTIYAGLTNDFGILSPDANGRLEYRSISQQFPEKAFGFNDIWKIFETADGIYFQAKNKIFLYHSQTLSLILPDKEFNFLHLVNKSLYTSERQTGLVRISGTQTSPAPGGGVFAGINIETIVPYDETRMIIGTAKNGLYLYDGKTAVPWAAGASEFLTENSIFCGTTINKKYFAFGTIQNGIVILDKTGRVVQHINQDKGLQNNTVLCMMADRDNNLWLGLDQGISYLEINSPISFYSYGKSLPGTGYCTIATQDHLYAGTNQGLFIRKWTDYEDPLDNNDRFTLVPGTQGQVWSLREIDNTLFCGHNLGTYLVNGMAAKLISDIPGGWDYLRLVNYPDIILGGTYTGISLYAKGQSGWTFSRTLLGFNESTRSFTEDSDGSIWVGHGGLGIFRIVTDAELKTTQQIRVYNESDGLPSRYRNSLFKIDNQILFTTVRGVYRYNRKNDSFESHPLYEGLLGTDPVSSLFEDTDGNVWYFRPDEIGVIRSAAGGLKTVDKRPFNPIKKLTNRSYEYVNVVDDQNIFIASEQGFVHYDPSFPAPFPEARECFIRSLTGTGDSTVTFFGGAFSDDNGMISYTQNADQVIRIPYAFNNLRFEFTVPLFDNPEDIRFRYFLDGFDKAPSDWISSESKEYTGLHEGTYRFSVRGKSIYDIETTDNTLVFKILPPWYRSLAAYLVYFLLIAAAVFLTAKRIVNRFHREKRRISLQHERDINNARQEFISESLESEKRLALLEKEKLEAEVSHKNKQLANSISGLLKKNEFLIQLREELARLSEKPNSSHAEERIRKILSSLDHNLEADNEYEQFEIQFDAVHDNFLQRLKLAFPQLTPKDLRLCAYLRMNLSTKEIAPLLNISPRGVEISRYRLRKKMNLPHDANLIELMLKI